VHREAQSIGWSTMTIDDLQVAIRQRVEAVEVALGQSRRDTHKRIALIRGEEPRRLGYHAPISAGMRVRAGSGMGPANLSQ
jgi:hypothetical protein